MTKSNRLNEKGVNYLFDIFYSLNVCKIRFTVIIFMIFE